MIRYFSRRLLRAAVLLFAVSAISFGLFELAPGDYFDELRSDPARSTETIEALRKQHGLDDPVTVRYVRWLGSALRGEWGFSIAYNSPAGPLLFERARNTLILTGSAALCAWAIAIPFALWTAGGGIWRHRITNTVVALLLSLPDLLILLVFMALAAHWRMLPAGGMTSPEFSSMTLWSKMRDLALHMFVPLAALVLAALPPLILHTRAGLAEALNAPFIKFARANGIPRGRLLVRHALPAAANPMITLLGLSAGTLLSSGLLAEAVAGWPGLGQLLLDALLQRDLPVVAGAVLLSSLFLISGNLLADVLIYATNPVIREDN